MTTCEQYQGFMTNLINIMSSGFHLICNIFLIIITVMFIVFFCAIIFGIIMIIIEEKYKYLVRKALCSKNQQMRNTYTYRYANRLMKSVNMNKLHDPEKFSCMRLCWYLSALTKQQKVMEKNPLFVTASFRDYLVDYIDHLKIVLKNTTTSDVDMKKKDLIMMLLSVMQVNFLYDEDHIFNENSMYLTVKKDSDDVDFSKKKDSQNNELKNPEQWIEELKAEKPLLMSEEWYDTLLEDLHCFNQYIKNFHELRFSSLVDICIYVNS